MKVFMVKLFIELISYEFWDHIFTKSLIFQPMQDSVLRIHEQ